MAVKQNESSDSEKISLRFQDPELQCPSYTAIYNQFQDLVRTQTSMAAKLRYMVEKQQDNVSREDFEELKRSLEDEAHQHMQTKSKLMNREKELEFALAEVSLLTKELEKEKEKYKRICNQLKKLEEIRATENNVLLEKCTEISQVCGVQDDILTVKDKKIRDLEERLAEQGKTRRMADNENELRLQQERYMIGHNYANPSKIDRNRGNNRLRSKFK